MMICECPETSVFDCELRSNLWQEMVVRGTVYISGLELSHRRRNETGDVDRRVLLFSLH